LRNELRVHSLRLGIHFSSEDVKNPCHFECPHRLSDKLLKSSATWLSAHRCEVAYITLSSFRVNPLFQDFFSSTDRVVCEVIHIRRVDGGAL
ncbi:hypothetical protein ACHHZ9_21445, partial [Enterobacter cloacae complex sp. 2024EL-00232]|uniref:hypothetical protein n=1 Tax=unclassified Enterobacter cloacae complex TaxID=2757714 RepID=UPI001E540657